MYCKETNKTPKHIAIIMDGNGRWARKKHLPRSSGHKAGVKTLRKIVEACTSRGVEVLTVYAFSSENWRRPKEEVGLLMELFMAALKDEIADLNKNNIRVSFIGNRGAFPKKLREAIHQAELTTESNDGLRLIVAANYGGRWDIVNACKAIVDEIRNGVLRPDEIDENLFNQKMSLSDCSAPDLFVRTGGERRISNYLVWQIAYTELYFTDVLWPDFGDLELDQAIAWFNKRQRRFGRTPEQITKASA